MSAAATTSAPTPQAGPKAGAEPPPRIARLLFVVRWLINYGQQALAGARQRVSAPDFFLFAAPFGTPDIAVIINRITRGIRLAQALEQRLLRRAASGRDIGGKPSSDAGAGRRVQRKPLSAEARAKAAERRAARRREEWLDRLPSVEEIAEMVRRQPIGAVVAEVCACVGVMPGNLERGMWRALMWTMLDHGGGYARFVCGMMKRSFSPALRGLAKYPAPPGEPDPLIAAMMPHPAALFCTGPP